MKKCLRCGAEYDTEVCHLCLEIDAYAELYQNTPPVLWPVKNWKTIKKDLTDYDRDYIEARTKLELEKV